MVRRFSVFVYLLLKTSHAILPSEEIHRLGTEFVPKSLLAKAGLTKSPSPHGEIGIRGFQYGCKKLEIMDARNVARSRVFSVGI
jgi:hypothetical protein